MAMLQGGYVGTIDATVCEIYSKLGIAYVVDGGERTWGVSRSTPGASFEALEAGRRVRIEVRDFENSSLVTEYQLLD